MTIVAALDRAIEDGGWICQGDDGVWFRPDLMFNRWVGVDGEPVDDSLRPRDLLDDGWHWTPSANPVTGDPALVRR